jgi:hypothetical protein
VLCRLLQRSLVHDPYRDNRTRCWGLRNKRMLRFWAFTQQIVPVVPTNSLSSVVNISSHIPHTPDNPFGYSPSPLSNRLKWSGRCEKSRSDTASYDLPLALYTQRQNRFSSPPSLLYRARAERKINATTKLLLAITISILP